VKLRASGIAVCPQEGIKHVLNWFVLNYKAVNKEHSGANSTPFIVIPVLLPSLLSTVIVLKGLRLWSSSGLANFYKASVQILYKFWRNTFACPWEP
jgi:hypothetical protein